MQLDDYPRAGLDGSVYLGVVAGVGYECATEVDVLKQPVKVRRDDGSFEKIPSSESETPCVRRYSAFRRGLKTLERACGGSIRSMLLSEKARQNHVRFRELSELSKKALTSCRVWCKIRVSNDTGGQSNRHDYR